jgi:DNA-binding beta-propeller fold protein YncE
MSEFSMYIFNWLRRHSHAFANIAVALVAASVFSHALQPGNAAAAASEFLGPVAVAASRNGDRLFVANADAQTIAVVSATDRKVLAAIAMPAAPTGLSLSSDGRRLYVSCAAAKSTICVIDAASNAIINKIPAGHTATGLAVSPDNQRCYVCNRFDNDASTLDLASGKTLFRTAAAREPVAAAVTPDGRWVFVINHLPLACVQSGDVAAAVSVIDAAATQRETPCATIRLPNGSTGMRGICMSPDGRYVLVTHILSRYLMPTTQLERGWMNTNAMSVIDVKTKQRIATVLLDDVERGAANPWGVAMTADGRWICVSHAGTNELSVIDANALFERLAKLAFPQKANERPDASGRVGSAALADASNDLSFLVDIRRRIGLPGGGLRGLAIVGRTAYVAEYFSDAIAAVDLDSGAVAQIALRPMPKLSLARRGQMLFEDAGLCFQNWQSCATCHPDARADGLNWDLMNDGIGNPKNTRSMLLTRQDGPSMALGVRENPRAAIRAGIAHIQFADRPEEDVKAIDEYFKSLKPIPSPRLVDGQLSPAAERGQKIFFDEKIGCANCHPAPDYSDKLPHDVGSASELDRATRRFYTPGLHEVWRTAPYLHDGRYWTIKELFIEGRHGGTNGELAGLDNQQLDDLVEFVLSL